MDAMVDAAPNSLLPSSPRARFAAGNLQLPKSVHDPAPPPALRSPAGVELQQPSAVLDVVNNQQGSEGGEGNNLTESKLGDPTAPAARQATAGRHSQHPSTATATTLLDNSSNNQFGEKPLVSNSNFKADDHHPRYRSQAAGVGGGMGADLESQQGNGNYNGGAGPWGVMDDAAQGHWHYSHRSPWLRALVLGANDGLVSISSLMLGVGAVKNDSKAMVVSGLAGLVAGAGSMAIGEFVSVFSQRDTELADIEKERQEHAKGPEAQARELEELTQIYVGRGLPYYLAKQVAEEFSRVDVLKAHARDELGIDIDALSNPLQAALASALAFSLGGGVPLLAGAFVLSYKIRIVVVVAVSSIALALFGTAGARLGGAPMTKAALRVLLGGWLAMGFTYGILKVLGTAGF